MHNMLLTLHAQAGELLVRLPLLKVFVYLQFHLGPNWWANPFLFNMPFIGMLGS